MRLTQRIIRHATLSWKGYWGLPSPPFLILFINSVCNMKCEHCFYWRDLNRRDDLSKDELFALSRSLGRIENLNLSGGEPFLRKDFAEICRQFVRQNGVRQIYVPTNGFFTDKIVAQVSQTLADPAIELFAIELSLDGMAEFHDRFRGCPGAFAHAMETYDALALLQEKDERLRIHAVSTATNINIAEIRQLTTYLFERCPRMDHHNLAIIRGDRKNPSLLLPDIKEYEGLYEYMQRLWLPHESGRYGAIVEPMLQWTKLQTIAKGKQIVPCRAGRLSAVVYANGDVSVCELHKPLGNLRDKPFWDIWSSAEAAARRRSIAAGDCHCTTEVFMWPSIVFQPLSLAKAMLGARVWRKVEPLSPGERAPIAGAGQQTRAADAVELE